MNILDVHGLTIAAAIKLIQEFIVKNPKLNCIEVIHGFNNGSAIKKVLQDKNNIHNKRVIKTLPVPSNEGRTFIKLRII